MCYAETSPRSMRRSWRWRGARRAASPRAAEAGMKISTTRAVRRRARLVFEFWRPGRHAAGEPRLAPWQDEYDAHPERFGAVMEPMTAGERDTRPRAPSRPRCGGRRDGRAARRSTTSCTCGTTADVSCATSARRGVRHVFSTPCDAVAGPGSTPGSPRSTPCRWMPARVYRGTASAVSDRRSDVHQRARDAVAGTWMRPRKP
jgi:hypothetical protein